MFCPVVWIKIHLIKSSQFGQNVNVLMSYIVNNNELNKKADYIKICGMILNLL